MSTPSLAKPQAGEEATETSRLLPSTAAATPSSEASSSSLRPGIGRGGSYAEQSSSIRRSFLRHGGRSLSAIGDRIEAAYSSIPSTPGLPSATHWGPHRHHNHRGLPYDEQRFEDELQAKHMANGVRVWYESYTTIDWIHDAIKESSRRRRLRAVKGLRGAALNAWDRLQGWIIVTIVGILTAFIAGAVVQSEAVLFDLKDGYCERDWKLAKRFCCPFANQPDYDMPPIDVGNPGSNFTRLPRWSYASAFSGASSAALTAWGRPLGGSMLAGWAAPVAGSPAWRKVGSSVARNSTTAVQRLGALAIGPKEEESCPGWVRWGEKFSTASDHPGWWAEYGTYILIAVVWASIASLLTVFLTSSELYQAPPTELATGGRASEAAEAEDSVQANENGAINGFGAINGNGESSRPVSTASNALPPKMLAQIAQQQRAEKALPPRKILYFGSGSGISEIKVILSGFVIHGYLGSWTLFTKAVGLTLSVASGLSLGKEGPFVHMASCVGNIVCRLFDKFHTNEAKRREILSCACAAGVAVAFGAPVGGVLFSLEEVSSYFPAKVMFRSFFCAMVAAATLRAIDPFGTGKIVLFQVTYDKEWHFYELAFFIVIGIFGGIYGAVFTKLNMIWTKQVRSKTWMARKPVLEVVMITILTAFVSFGNGYMKMGGAELIADLFSECHEHEYFDGLCVATPEQIRPLISSLVFAMIAKGALTIITFGIKLPAGIFIPTLAVGAVFGRIVGLLVQYTQWIRPDLPLFDFCDSTDSSCIVPGVYAMVGAAAALSGVTRTTVSLVVIMFELTGTLTYSIPVMLSVLIARTIADALEHKGIYDLVIEFSGLPFLDSKAEYIWSNVSVHDAMDTNVEVIWLDRGNTISSLRQKLARLALGSGYTDGGFPIVVSDAGKKITMVGYIAAPELEHALGKMQEAEGDSETTCTFTHIAYRGRSDRDAGADADAESGTDAGTDVGGEGNERPMRDSLFLSSNEPNDLSRYVDKAPITVMTHSPLELVHQYFTKLGVRYLIVNDEKGHYRGVIFKKRYLKFLEEVEANAH